MAPTSATLENDKQRSIEAAETELLSLHEDNFARVVLDSYRLASPRRLPPSTERGAAHE
jgi:hypothetical protein